MTSELTSSEITNTSIVIIPNIQIQTQNYQQTDSDTIPMKPISPKAQSARNFGTIVPTYRTPQTARNANNNPSKCCLLI